MGFAIYYRSTRPVSAKLAESIRKAVDVLNAGRTWLSCEPVGLRPADPDGRLFGGSKPNFQPHPDDVAAAESEGLPDGTVNDVIDILCTISREYRVDWEFSHDHDPGPVGYIRQGVCDPNVRDLAQGFDDLGDILAAELRLAKFEDDEPDKGDDEPRILKFRPRNE